MNGPPNRRMMDGIASNSSFGVKCRLKRSHRLVYFEDMCVLNKILEFESTSFYLDGDRVQTFADWSRHSNFLAFELHRFPFALEIEKVNVSRCRVMQIREERIPIR